MRSPKHRRFRWAPALAAFVMIGLASSTAPAGPKGYQCSLDTQACLDMMVSKLKKRGWLGIEYDNSQGSDKLKITRVVPQSPASAAGFAVGDILVSINGAKFADNDEDRCVTCEKTKDAWKPGSTVQYVVRRGCEEIRLTPTLAEMRSDLLEMMVGLHMIEHAEVEPE